MRAIILFDVRRTGPLSEDENVWGPYTKEVALYHSDTLGYHLATELPGVFNLDRLQKDDDDAAAVSVLEKSISDAGYTILKRSGFR